MVEGSVTPAELTELARVLAPLVAAELARQVAPEPLRTKQEIADHFGVRLAQVDRWVRRGMPFQQIDSVRRFDLGACLAWHTPPEAPVSRVVDGGPVRLLSKRKAAG